MTDLNLTDLASRLATAGGGESSRHLGILQDLVSEMPSALKAGKRVAVPALGVLSIAGPGGEVADLVAKAASRVRADAEDVQNLWQLAGQEMAKAILEGKVVRLDGVADFRIRWERPRIVRDGKRGHRILSQSKGTLTFDPHPGLAKGAGTVVFSIDEDLRGKVGSARELAVLLAVPERDPFTRTLEYYFQQAGWNTQVSISAADALRKLESQGTYLVILDSMLEKYQELVESVKCRPDLSGIPLIVTFPPGTDLEKPRDFMICGDEHLVQPFEVKKLLTLADTELVRSSEESLFFRQQVTFQFPTQDEFLECANDLGQNLFRASGMPEEDHAALAVAFREAMGNAAQHGNRYRRDRKIEVQYLLDQEWITLTVRDKGRGFDHERYVKQGKEGDAIRAARERQRAGKLGGLGIMLMLRCSDHLEYTDVGNCITLRKRIRRPEAATESAAEDDAVGLPISEDLEASFGDLEADDIPVAPVSPAPPVLHLPPPAGDEAPIEPIDDPFSESID